MKKIFALLLVALVALSCTGCGDDNKTSYSKTTYSGYSTLPTAPSFDFDDDLDYEFDHEEEEEDEEIEDD